jgi:hypothetical protein
MSIQLIQQYYAKVEQMIRFGGTRNESTLSKYGYPPDKQEKATQTVLEQAEVIAKDWAG